jgi:ATP-dependent helicase HrpB
MVPLPIDPFLPDIVAKVRGARALVLVAEPGAGKTTRVPAAILRGGVVSSDNPVIVVLQPRRVAARTVAARIAEENGWAVGGPVGYHVRFDRRVGPETRLRVVTEGILTRQLLDDPFLEGVGCVVLDEFHERSLYTDVAIALLREVQQTVRPDLCIVVMSATLEAGPVAAYLGGCPVVRVPGRTYPVEVAYEPDESPLPARVAAAVERAIESGDGDVLAFLPGAEEIRRAGAALESIASRRNLAVLPLYGALTPGEQNLALRPDAAGRRKVVLATNIAETSLTIDGVRTVVDGGFARVASYDPERGLDRLDLQRISRAAADQRAGRAGRTGPGRCVRVWAEREKLAAFELPEIRRVDLAGTVLSLHAWGKPDVRGFGWYEAPSEGSVAAAERLLDMLGAMEGGRITAIGKRLAGIPAHPRLGRLLLAAAGRGLLREGASMAALVSEKDIVLPGRRGDLRGPTTAGTSDLIHRLELLDEAERQRFGVHLFDRGVDPAAARAVAQARDELLRVGRSLSPAGAAVASEEDLLRLPLNAYPDRVCRRRASDPAAAAIVGGGGVRLAPESAVRRGDFFLAIDLRHDPWSAVREATVRVASALEPAWLGETFPGSVRRERGAEYDAGRERVVGFVRTWYRDLVIADEPNAAVEAGTAGAVLAEALRPRAAELFAADEAAASLLARVGLLRLHLTQYPWPAFDEGELGDVLAEACAGKRSLEELRRGGTLAGAVRNRLAYPMDRVLEEQAPEGIAVPSGNRIRLEYAGGGPPVLAVRLQELFGWTQTPRVAGGRVRVRLHLLGPNYRPVQVTDDLANFWATTYFQVRKDLRARYPKHSWPEEPLAAKAEARGRPRQ